MNADVDGLVMLQNPPTGPVTDNNEHDGEVLAGSNRQTPTFADVHDI